MNKYLTKSKFKLALECPTKLYYQEKKEYINKKLDDDFLRALAKGGFQVGELAKCYYPGGINIHELDHETALRKTNELLNGDCIIYEAAFTYDSLFIRSDVILKSGKRIRLIEVKAKSIDSTDEKDTLFSDRENDIRKKWKPYVYDVAFQKYVILKSCPDCKVECTLLLVDKSKLATVDGLNQKFLIQTDSKGRIQVKIVGDVSTQAIGDAVLAEIQVDDLVDGVLNERKFRDNPLKSFEEWIHFYSDAHQKDQIVFDNLGGKCVKCEFHASDEELKNFKSGYHECWTKLAGFTHEDFRKPSILKIHDFRKKDDYIATRKYFQENLTRADLETNVKKKAVQAKANSGLSRIDRQEIQIEKSKSRDTSPYVDTEGLRVSMSTWKYPLHFIDFETTAVALPFNKGRRPYEQIVFQYSHHTMLQDGTVEHKGQWLNDKVGEFPNFDFVRALKNELKSEGTIFRYAAHENSILNSVYRQLKASNEKDKEELCEWIKTITKSTQGSVDSWEGHRNMVDLRELVYSYYYHPLTEGSNSLKDLLPAILNSSKFLNDIYSKPLYGSTIKSLNFKDHVWLNRNDNKSLVNPYDLLPPIFKGISSSLMDSLIMEEDAELQDGGAAMIAYSQMQFSQMTDEERLFIRHALLQYCELDTLAMVMIVQEWIQLTK